MMYINNHQIIQIKDKRNLLNKKEIKLYNL